MMPMVFISGSDRAPPRWEAAFPDLELRAGFDAALSPALEAVYWVDLHSFGDDEATLTSVSRLTDAGATVVALSDMPDEREAFDLLSRGARGYCHVQAAPAQLQEVAQVVGAGALWMPSGLVQRLLTLARRVDRRRPSPEPGTLDALTEREQEVALLVGRGFNNREIAASLEVSERTVKANLTAIFDKLALRDRVQLALYVNRLPIY